MLSRLLAATPWARRSPDGGDNFPDSRRRRFRVGGDAPSEPSTVAIYATGPDGATTGRLLAADFDVSKAAAAADPAALVAAEAADFAGRVEECGGRVVHDVSPSGGRHVYVRFARPIPFEELRAVAVALADRYTTLDPSPMLSPSGQIRIAGSPYKREPVEQRDGKFRRTGRLIGFMALTMPLSDAVRVLRRPCGPTVWERLREGLAAELAAADPAPSLSAPLPGEWHLDAHGRPWLPLRGGRRPLPPRLAELARTGGWRETRLQPEDGPRYASPSEARFAVLRSAAAAGWSYREILDAARPGGAFAGLDALLSTRSASQRRAALARDWDAAARKTREARAVHHSARNLHTSSVTHPPQTAASATSPAHWPIPRALADTPAHSARFHQELTRWQTAVWLAERDPVQSKDWGRRAPSIRLVLRAMALAVRLSSDTTTAFGCRSLALMSGLSWRTVAVALADLREARDPLIDLVQRGRDLDADRYALRIPDAYRAESARTVLQAGRIETGHPVWLAPELGPTCALVYETLSTIEARPVDLERRAVLSARAVSEALAALGAYGLAVRGPDGWRRGDRALDDAAAELDAFDLFAERLAAYRAHRADWHAFLESVHPLRAALADLTALEAAFAEHDRHVPEHDVGAVADAAEFDAELRAVLDDAPGPADPTPAEPAAVLAAAVPVPARALDDAPDATLAALIDGPQSVSEPVSATPPAEPPPTPVPPPVSEILARREAAHEVAARRGASLARRLMTARTPDERERILAETRQE
ncbi:hypothetical protein AB0C74_38755 [Spirillospora sp. NPDC048832]